MDIIIRRLRNEKGMRKSTLQQITITVHPSIEILLPQIRIILITWHLLNLSTTLTEIIVPLSADHFELPNNINNHTPSNVSHDPYLNTPILSPQNHTSSVPPPFVKVPTITSKIPPHPSPHTIIPISTMRCHIETHPTDIPLKI